MMSRAEYGSADETFAMEEILEGSSDIKINREDESVKDVTDGDLDDGEIVSSNCPSSFSDDSGFSSDFDWRECIPESMLTIYDYDGEKMNSGSCDCLDQESEMKEGNCDCEHECSIVTEGTGTCLDHKGVMMTGENSDCENHEIMKEDYYINFDHKGEMISEGSCVCIEEGEMVKRNTYKCAEKFATVVIGNSNCRDKGEKVEIWNEKVSCNCGSKDDKVNEETFDCHKDGEHISRQNPEMNTNCNKSELINVVNGRDVTDSLVNKSLHTSHDRGKINLTQVQDTAENIPDIHSDCVLWNTNADLIKASTEINVPICRRERHDSVPLEAPARHRTVRRRRSRAQDLNNNEASTRSFRNFLMAPPFKLQDCFHDQGLLSLIACIIYTLILMLIISALSKFLDSFKSSIGTQRLKKMRRNIVLYSRTRMSMASG